MTTLKLTELYTLPIFPYADEFPIVDDEELLELAQDLEINGQQHPILIFEGQILDGRNRLQAFRRTNLTEAKVEYFEGTEFQAVELVRSVNILRRHLSVGQRAMAALAYLPYEEAEAKRRQGARTDLELQDGSVTKSPEKQGKARDVVAEKFNLSGPRISEAKNLALNAPDLADDVKSGDKSLDKATRELKARREENDTKLRALENNGRDLLKRYESRELTLEDAYVQLIARQAAAKREAQLKSESLFLIQNFASAADVKLREFNLKIAKMDSLEFVDEALQAISSVEANLAVTRHALQEAKIQLGDERVGG